MIAFMSFCALLFVVITCVSAFIGAFMSRYPSEYIFVVRCPNTKCDKPLEAPFVKRSRRYDTIKQTQSSISGNEQLCPHCSYVFPDADRAQLAVGRFRRFTWEWR